MLLSTIRKTAVSSSTGDTMQGTVCKLTQDYGLAAMCLARKAVPVSQDGMVYTADNIDALLLARHTAKKIRMSGGRLKGSPKRTPEQNAAFERKLKELLPPWIKEN